MLLRRVGGTAAAPTGEVIEIETHIVMRQLKSSRIALNLRGLIGGGDIFRVSGGLQHDPDVEIWLTADPTELRSRLQLP